MLNAPFTIAFIAGQIVALSLAAQWTDVGGGTNAMVSAMHVHDGHLYVGGDFVQAGTLLTNDLARWDGAAWSSANPPFTVHVLNFLDFDGDLLSCGAGLGGGTTAVIEEVGGSWQVVGTNGPGFVYAMEEYQGELHAVGVSPWMRFSAGTWITMGSAPSLRALAKYQGDLIVAGSFTDFNGQPLNNIFRWNGSTLSPMGLGVLNGFVLRMVVYNNELYVGGGFDAAQGNADNNLMKWNGTTWLPTYANIGHVWALDSLNGKLYCGDAGGNARVWDGSSWTTLPSFNNRVEDFEWFQGQLYACGIFTMAGGTLALNIARMDAETGWADAAPTAATLSVLPQPNSGLFQLNGLGSVTGPVRITATDLAGRIVSDRYTSGTTTVDMSNDNLSDGLYHLTLHTEEGIIGTTKLVIRKGTEGR